METLSVRCTYAKKTRVRFQVDGTKLCDHLTFDELLLPGIRPRGEFRVTTTKEDLIVNIRIKHAWLSLVQVEHVRGLRLYTNGNCKPIRQSSVTSRQTKWNEKTNHKVSNVSHRDPAPGGDKKVVKEVKGPRCLWIKAPVALSPHHPRSWGPEP